MNPKVMRFFLGVVPTLLGFAGCSDDSGPTLPPPAAARAAYVGAEVCKDCHGNLHAQWSQTAHAKKALATLERIGQNNNAVCLRCHTTGFGVRNEAGDLVGYVNQEQTPHLANVQCESCHGPGGEHVARPSADNIQKSLDAEVCGTCHNDPHHPTIEDWRQSAHAKALTTIQNFPYGQDECLDCHSAERRLAENNLPTLRSRAAAQSAVTCGTCHNPHAQTGNDIHPLEGRDFQLRKPADEICVQCHTAEEPLPDETPHHPQGEMLAGTGGFAADGRPQAGPNSPHTTLVEKTCVQCHVHRLEVADPTLENPVVTGHTFRPRLEACAGSGCHADVATAEARKNAAATDISQRLANLAPSFDPHDPRYVPPPVTVADRERYNVAKFNYLFVQADASQGVHNAAYARTLLEVAQSIMGSLSGRKNRP